MAFNLESFMLIFQLTFYFILLLSLNLYIPKSVTATKLGNETDKLALLDFKSKISDDPFGVLASWNKSFPFCQWVGVTCGLKHQRVVSLHLHNQKLVGTISPHVGNLSFLRSFNLAINSFHNEIPSEVGCLFRLREFNLSNNLLQGEIPVSLSRCTKLINLQLGYNLLKGRVPFELGTDIGLVLPNLQILVLTHCQFSGPIPASLSNASDSLLLGFGENNPMLQILFFLILSFYGNRLRGDSDFLTSLTNCSKLRILDISLNQFGGILPTSIVNLSSQLTWLMLGGNNFGGNIPPEISNLFNLNVLVMSTNLLWGNIPASIGKLSKLHGLYLAVNQLTGEIPFSLGNLTQLLTLNLRLNNFSGSIPSRTCKIGNLQSTVEIYVSNNKLSSEIPSTLGRLFALQRLHMHGNLFEGSIPPLNGLKGLRYLDLSRNNLSARFPQYLETFSSLIYVNLSFNNLDGEVPSQGIFQNATAVKLQGNINLCEGIPDLHLKPCLVQKHKKGSYLKLILLIVIPFLFLALAMVFLSVQLIRKMKMKRPSLTSVGQFHPKISYQELLNATGGFSSGNLIGSGSFGVVYTGTLCPEGTNVAVKVLKLSQCRASKSFMVECRALSNIRHRNLVRIITACSSIDFGRNDFNALVYEFMPNGSLEHWLHPENGHTQLRNLDLLQRIKIAIDVASALHYLHKKCEARVIHCDVKPSNVLLDNDFTAHLSDFGLARLLSKSGIEAVLSQFNSVGVMGTTGYTAPEYGMGARMSTHGDVYCYGILLLEMFTGKRPTDKSFSDDLNLHNSVKMALPVLVTEVVDQFLLTEGMQEAQSSIGSSSNHRNECIECLTSILEIGIACSAESPSDRMDIKDVEYRLLSIRGKFIGPRRHH
ncbi:unnamed protein product [Ilex paraguariensis]|uniref:non-specific serine/threonine protein kinase n=1 Tax=Ilex paraguariensis TaxID=185542 RepID=A0ABC8RAV3_9AQUA